jgi:AraC-like DNA-binding protein
LKALAEFLGRFSYSEAAVRTGALRKLIVAEVRVVLENDREGSVGLEVPPRWIGAPRWFLWGGGFLMFGSSEGTIPLHQHHAIQIVISCKGNVSIRGARGEWRTAPGIAVMPDVLHSYNANGTTGAMLFIDPESMEGAWIKHSLRDEIILLPEARLLACRVNITRFIEQPLDAPEVTEIVRQCVQQICGGARPTRRLDPRVTRVLRDIYRSEEPKMSLEEAAARAFLSPSRFAHLFKQQLGLPFRRYMLWRKLTRSMLAIGRDESITNAAHAAGFADGAHLTRTYYQMFGLPPSIMMRGEFFEIPSPFELPAPVAQAS